MADAPNPLRVTPKDVVADRFAALLDSEEEGIDAAGRSEAGQGDVVDDPEPDEPEGEEPEGEEPDPEVEDEPEGDDPDAEPTPPTPKTKKVKDESGKVVEVDEDEAESGYLRLQDYTRKTQAAAKQRQEAEALMQEARTKRETYDKNLENAETYLKALVPKEPDWATLRATKSPEEYGAIRANWDEYKTVLDRIEVERKKVAEDRQKEFEKARVEYVSSETEKLVAKKPEWKDPAKFEKDRKEMVKWLNDQGWSTEQIDMVADHRLVLALYNDMRYQKARAGAPAPRVGQQRRSGIRVASPGVAGAPPKPKTARENQEATLERLRKTGKTDDAARHFETLL